MYNLKKIFATLSFEQDGIKLLVLDSTESESHCLFFDKIELDYSYDFSNIIALENVVNALQELIFKANNFLGLHIARYIINIPFINVDVTNYESPRFNLLNRYCDENTKYSLIEKTSLLKTKKDKVVFSANIIKWNVDGELFEKYPLNKPGKNISFLCSTCWCDEVIFQNIKKVLQTCNVDVISFVCNACLTSNNETCAYVSINDKNVTIYKNYKRYDIDTGVASVFKHIQDDVNPEMNVDIKNMINCISNTYNIKFPVPVLNIYSSKYMDLTQLTQKQLINGVNKYVDKLVNSIEENIVGFNNIIINGSDNFYKLLESNIKFNFTKPHEFVKINSDLISYHNIGSLVNAYKHVYNKLVNCSKDIIYSINPYISENFNSNQTINKALIKLGIISTNWAAKIG